MIANKSLYASVVTAAEKGIKGMKMFYPESLTNEIGKMGIRRKLS